MERKKEYRLGYRGDIEGLRAIAVLFVVGVHAGVPWLQGGFVGVDIFFVLSGFLITGLLAKEITWTGRLQFADFYLRRLRRLLPALALMLLATCLAASLLLAPSQQLSQSLTGVAAAEWISNFYFAFQKLDYFAAGTETNIYLHTWSLGVEEQFYLIWPVLVYWLLRRKERKVSFGRLRLGMMAFAGLSLVACVVATYRAPQWAFYLMPLRAWQFAAGALIWLEFQEEGGKLHDWGGIGRHKLLLGAVGLMLLLACGISLSANVPYPGLLGLIPTLGAAFVIGSGSAGADTFIQRFLSLTPLQAIGRVSYAWYLWHWPVLLLGYALTGVDTPVYRSAYVAVSLVLAFVSYRFVESPIRHQRWWLSHKRIATCVAFAVMAGSIWVLGRWTVGAGGELSNPAYQRFDISRRDQPLIYAMGCDDSYLSDRVKPCDFGDAKAKHTAVLLGDSIAGQWFPAVAKVFDRPDWRLVVLTKSACPMIDKSIFYPRIGRMYTECDTWRRTVLADLAQMRPDIVLISSQVTSTSEPKEWADESARVLKLVSAAAKRVYLLRATPHLTFDGPDCLAEHAFRPQWLRGHEMCSSSLKEGNSDVVYASIERTLGSFNNVEGIDVSANICPGEVCSAERNGMIIFRDSQHLTATFAATLAPALMNRIKFDNNQSGANK
ncbi:acyltransferase family protein [Dyella mobilis]|uniref:Acyltransferase n=1 Tax=Dyella mobilis TaxID=1849582 RepID=A0ABS2KFY6_9GAMM|nr:acyltransferase family protein [Dyella mobilis]MBM7130071.1 acyltransferase [Dyella mobilis]GLQ96697.1 acyltransferase [Dyella mobilis]